MSWIKKHPVITAITILLIVFIFTFFLFPESFITTSISSECYEVPDDIAYRITSHETGVTYELSDLKTDGTVSYPTQPPIIPVGYDGSGSIAVPQTSLYLIHEEQLSKGSQLTLQFGTEETMSGLYQYFLINEEGIVDSYETTTPAQYNINLKTKKSGNYAIILYVEDALGEYQLNFNIKKSLFPF